MNPNNPSKEEGNTKVSYESAGNLEAGTVTEGSRFQRFKDSFKPADLSHVPNYENLTELEKAAIATANSPLQRSLKGRHLQMIAIGGSIGTGLFVGSGKALHNGGPASLLIAFFLIGAMLYCTVHALGELTVRFPVSGAFSTFCTRFIDPAWGFAIGWNYGIQWLIVFPLELVAASMTIQYWNDQINAASWVAIFWVTVMIINLFGVKGYGEAEFIFSLIKVIAVIGFIILGIVINCGGAPQGGYIGGTYWYTPGAFNHGFKGLCSVFVTGAFSFTGTELVGLAAAETSNPRKTMPAAIKQVFWRITLFYLVSLAIVGLIVPYNDPQLLGSSSVDIAASPFVIAVKNAGIKVLPSIMNAVVLIAVLSVGNSAVYGCSRTISALSAQGHAPKFLSYIDRQGRPIFGIILSGAVGLLCFVAASDKESEVFAWLLALTGLSSIFTWGSICFCHIRFRAAMKVQGRSEKELAFKSQPGLIGSYFGVIFNILVLAAQFWTGLFPLGAPKADVTSFFQAYLAAPIVLVCFVFYKIWKKTKFISLEDMDLDTGRREVDTEALIAEIAEEKAYIQSKNFFYRTWKFWC
jgi:amino acid transporter